MQKDTDWCQEASYNIIYDKTRESVKCKMILNGAKRRHTTSSMIRHESVKCKRILSGAKRRHTTSSMIRQERV